MARVPAAISAVGRPRAARFPKAIRRVGPGRLTDQSSCCDGDGTRAPTTGTARREVAAVYQWTEEQQMVRDAVRQFIDKEIRPERRRVRARRHAALRRPAQAVRATSAWTSMARDRFAKQIAFEKAVAEAEAKGETPPEKPQREGDGGASSLTLIPIIELCRVCPGMVTAMGVSMGLTSAAIISQGHHRPEGALGRRPAHAGEDRRLGHHRARLGLRRLRLHEVHRPPGRRRVRAQRLQDVHHQRPLRRHHRLHLQARRGQRRPPSARCSPSSSTRACPASSSPSRCARWACTRRPPASCSSTTCGSASTA